MAFSIVGTIRADEFSDRETAVRAAFLFRLAFFVDWPAGAFADAQAPIVFCVASEQDDPLGRMLGEQTATRSVQGRPVEVRRLAEDANAAGCHVLYSNRSVLPALAPGQSTVAIVDTLAGLAQAGEFALVRENREGAEKLQFYVHRARLQQSGMNVRAQLMQLAKIYEPAG